MSPRNSAVAGTAGGPESRQQSSGAPTRSGRGTNEKVREQRLIDDDLVTILNPQLVRCNRCGTEIKLSNKSRFDTFHWYQHRERCLKKKGNELVESNAKSCQPAHTWPVATKIHAKRRDFVRPATPTAPSVAENSSTTDSTEASLPLSPISSFSAGSTTHTSATYELSSQAFERVQRWTLRGINESPSYFHALGEPYDEIVYHSPRSHHHTTFKESQVRGTYD
ncbi:hypothetical protein BDY19DRAFT_629809 [Irpex rosettiformis]|uniref:Uncharacterized protein n=1 Tax=Irpex rosettiformis TaxID=378272 RepID=A0ACB8UB12_9APHY|nr:hypothetical protein BDY19DRAFT_629809 [Irpex rosettiformis]